MMKNPDLGEFIYQTQFEIQSEYQRLKRRSIEDPGTTGDQGEKNWAMIFKNWLSPTFQVVTKGRIVSSGGKASPQIDILILRPEYPKKLIDKELFLVEGVLAAFECKTTLEHRGIKKTIENSKIIKSLPTNIDRKNSAYYELQSSVIYGLLANSHSWKGSDKKIVETISTKLCNLDKELIEHPREMLDLVCIADIGTWSASKWPITASYPENSEKVSETYYYSFTESLKKSNPNNKLFTPVGALVSKLTQKIAMEYEGIKSRKITFDTLVKYLNEESWLGQELDYFDKDAIKQKYTWLGLMGPSLLEFFVQYESALLSQSFLPNFIISLDSITLKFEGVLRDFIKRNRISTITNTRNGTREMFVDDFLNNQKVKSLFHKDDIEYFKYVFTSKGINVRNNVAHSFYKYSEYSYMNVILVLVGILRMSNYKLNGATE